VTVSVLPRLHARPRALEVAHVQPRGPLRSVIEIPFRVTWPITCAPASTRATGSAWAHERFEATIQV